MGITAEEELKQTGEFYNPVMDKFTKKSHLRWVLSHIAAHKGLMALFLLSVIVTTAIDAINPLVIGALLQNFIDGGTWNAVKNLAFILLILAIVRGIFGFGTSLIIEVASQRLERDVRDEYYASMLSKSMTFHDEVKQGDVMARATFDTRMVNFFVNPVVHLLFAAGFGVIFTLVSIIIISPLWYYIPVLLIVPLLIVFPVYIFAKRFYHKVGPISATIQESYSSLSSYLQEKLLGISVVKTFAREPYERTDFTKTNNKLSDEIILRGKYRSKYIPVLFVGTSVGLSVVWGSMLIDLGVFEIGELISYSLLMTNLFFPVWILSWMLVITQMGFAGAERIVEILTKKTIIPEPQNPIRLDKVNGDIEFDDVTFSYDGKTPVIKNVSFKVPNGSRVAIVGPAGCGKTTLMKLLTRLYDTESGNIFIDGHNVRDLAFDTIRRNVGVIEQDIVLFSATIKENISYGNPEASDSAIIKAAKMAQADEFIEKFDKKYETIVGERGTTLSGGQKQRIAIARMLLSDPTILVFDDASSAVDSETEDKINTAINRVLKNRTSFIITHRLSTIRHSDIIVVLKNGEVKAIGGHDDLLKTSVDYWRVFARFSEIRKMMPEEIQGELGGE